MTDTFEQIGDVAKRVVMEADPWSWWRAALDNPKSIGKALKVTTSPEWGRYRVRDKNGPWEPVAIWQLDNGDWIALRGREQRRINADDIWTWCCRHPISLDEYDNVVSGADFSDTDPVVNAQRTPPRPGSNEPVDEAEILKDQIASAIAGAEKYAKIDSDDMAAKAQSLRSRLLELEREGDKNFRSEKDPIVKRGKEIDERWRFRSEAVVVAKNIRDALDMWETAKLQKRRAEEEAARKAAAEAEERRREAEASFLTQEPAPLLEPALPPAAAPETTIRGSYGRAATVSAEFVVENVDNYDLLYGYMKEHPDLKAKLLELAQRAVKAGRRDIPGITIQEIAKVR